MDTALPISIPAQSRDAAGSVGAAGRGAAGEGLPAPGGFRSALEALDGGEGAPEGPASKPRRRAAPTGSDVVVLGGVYGPPAPSSTAAPVPAEGAGTRRNAAATGTPGAPVSPALASPATVRPAGEPPAEAGAPAGAAQGEGVGAPAGSGAAPQTASVPPTRVAAPVNTHTDGAVQLAPAALAQPPAAAPALHPTPPAAPAPVPIAGAAATPAARSQPASSDGEAVGSRPAAPAAPPSLEGATLGASPARAASPSADTRPAAAAGPVDGTTTDRARTDAAPSADARAASPVEVTQASAGDAAPASGRSTGAAGPAAVAPTLPNAPPASQAGQPAALPPAPPEAGVVVQVHTRIVERFEGRARQIEVRLDPPELGRVDVRIEIGSDQRVHAVLSAHDAAALAELKRGADDLRSALADAGLDLADDGLQFDMAPDPGAEETAADGDRGERSRGRPNWLLLERDRPDREASASETPPVPIPPDWTAAAPWRRARLDIFA